MDTEPRPVSDSESLGGKLVVKMKPSDKMFRNTDVKFIGRERVQNVNSYHK